MKASHISPSDLGGTQSSENQMSNKDALDLIKLHIRLDQIERNQHELAEELTLTESFLHNLTHQATIDHTEYTRLCNICKELSGYEKLFGEEWPISAEKILENKPEYQRIIDNFIKKNLKK